MRALIRFFATQKLFGDLFTVFVFIVGISSLFLIKREVFPNVSFDIITVTTLFGGASPEEAEKLITNPIEQDLQEVDGIKKMRSVSAEGRSFITLQLDPDQTTEAEAKNDIQDVIDRFVGPSGAERSVVTAIQSKHNPILEVALSGPFGDQELRQISRDIERRLEKVSGVAKVTPKGLRDREVWIETDPAKLSRFRLSLDDVIRALQRQNVSIPAGVLEGSKATEGQEKFVRTLGEFKTLKDIENTVIRANDVGADLRVKDVAKVHYALEKATIKTRANGQAASILTVMKKENGDAIDMVEKVKAAMVDIQSKLLPEQQAKLEVDFINDMSIFVKRRIGVLSGNLLLGLGLVLVLLGLLMPFRIAVLTAIGIPFAFLGTLFLFHARGDSINLLSLLGMIIVSGMLVDDAIVVVDNAMNRFKTNKNSLESAVEGTIEVWPAVTASVLTTTLAFAPMLFMSGIFGKFVRHIPLAVIFALLISLIESFFILPRHMGVLLRAKDFEALEKGKGEGWIARLLRKTSLYWDEVIVPRYVRYLHGLLKRRYMAAFIAMTLFIGSVFLAAKGMRFILFPPDGVEVLFIKGQAPIGSSLDQTSKMIEPIEKIVASLPKHELDDYITSVGIQQQDPHDPNTKRGSEYVQVTLYLSPEEKRTRKAYEILQEIKEKGASVKGFDRLTFERVNPGPPVGKPVSIGVRGKTYEEILEGVAYFKEKAAALKGLTDISDTYFPGKDELQIMVNGPEASAAGLSVASIGSTVRGAFDGVVATSIQELDDEIDLRVLYPQKDRQNASVIGSILVPNPMGNLIPLSSVARVQKGKGVAAYIHEAGEREVKVTAEINDRITDSNTANKELQKFVPEFKTKFPHLSLDFGGEAEDTNESLNSLMRAFGLAFLGIFFVLILTFGSLTQPFLVSLAIPLGVSAVILTFWVHGLPLSFMGMLGIVALSGVIVNNAIVFLDFVNQSRKQGIGKQESIILAAKMRVRPIFLTTATTVVGLLPTAYGIGGLDRFVVPIAMALGWGLALGSLFVIMLFPASIAILDDFEGLMARGFRKVWKSNQV